MNNFFFGPFFLAWCFFERNTPKSYHAVKKIQAKKPKKIQAIMGTPKKYQAKKRYKLKPKKIQAVMGTPKKDQAS